MMQLSGSFILPSKHSYKSKMVWLISRADVKSSVGQNLLQVRTYDCLISYDKHYQTPRFWLFGYDEVSSFGPPAADKLTGRIKPLLPLPKSSKTSHQITPSRQ